ncbi:hypothetical protein FB45DRAFT_1018599 [Roridomyces roridus]|uniref:Uncharacterized protein n=1 Tax=Roridomyces roridus TaxID=1738132 RepID=A0AAD7FZE3_9AGAR|nr:hypothetical protein FB45DRAFT_1018599 [Roridomyces roridus]
MDMPMRGQKEAPKTFKGKYTEVSDFIRHLERLFKKCKITDDADKCNYLMEYCSNDVQILIRSLDSYRRQQWSALRDEVLQSYDADRALEKYKPMDVITFTLKTKNTPCYTLTEWRKYKVKYITVAGGPYQRGHITRADYHTYFWVGIHQSLRMILENLLLQRQPIRNPSAYYKIQEINNVAEWHFRRNKHEALIINASDYGTQVDDDDTDDEASEFDGHELTKKTSYSHGKPETDIDAIASMIKTLNGMSPEDPEYAPLYFKMLKCT